MKRKELNWCLWYALVLAALTTLPYLLAFSAQGESWRFSGFLFAVEDGNSYIAKMLQGASGAWLFRTPYTTYPQGGVLAFLPYLLLGKLASGEALHEQLVVLFHLFRILAIPLAVLGTYRFVGLFVSETKWRRWATLLATAGGGLGWMLLLVPGESLLGSGPLEFYSPETFGFLGIYGIPHLVLARALLLFALAAYLEAPGTKAGAWKSGALLALLALVQPLAVLVGYAVIGAHLLASAGAARKAELRKALAPWLKAVGQIMLVSAPLVAYLAWSFLKDPYLGIWTEQNVIRSPHPLHYVLAYGALLPLAIAGGRKLAREQGARGLLPIAWVILIPALVYAPHDLQRRLPEGAWVAIVTLAAIGLAAWKRKKPNARAIATLLLVVSLPSAALLVCGGAMLALAPRSPVFVTVDQAGVFESLASRAEIDDVVLASFATSNALPAWAPVRVTVGHGPESARLEDVLPRVNAFYTEDTSDLERQFLLDEFGVRFVFWGPEERALGSWQPGSAAYLDVIIQSDVYEVFAIEAP